MNDELEQFKQLNLADYASAHGYTLNKQKSSKNALCYDHPNGDRVILGTDPKSGHSVYYSVRDDKDNGTIIDFVQKRQGLNLGQARKELRRWIGKGPRERPEIQPQPKPEPTTRDRAEQLRGLAACEQVAGQHKYLQSRGISPRTLDHFKERVFTDPRGNAIFPHYDQAGVSGLEIKNREFTGFSKGGEKGLWFHGPKDPERIIVCESAIDCMSHYQIHKPEKTMYVSTAGKMSPEAKQNLKSLLDRNDQAQVVAAFDNDKDGRKFGQELAEIAGREVKNGLPKEKDWNEQLKKEQELELERKRARDREYEHELSM